MEKKLTISVDSNRITEQGSINLGLILSELSKIKGIEVNGNNLEITYDSSLEGVIGQLFDKHLIIHKETL